MAIFNSYVSLPEGILCFWDNPMFISWMENGENVLFGLFLGSRKTYSL